MTLQTAENDPNPIFSMLINFLKNISRIFVAGDRVQRKEADWEDLGLVIRHYNEKRFSLVIEKCEITLRLSPTHPQANHFCAKALMALGEECVAKPYLLAALAANPDMAEAHSDMAIVLRYSEDIAEAQLHARRAVELAPAEWRYRLVLADVLEDLGRHPDALEQIAFAQEFAPDRFDVLQRLLKKLDQLGKFDMALRIAERAMHENGETYETNFFMGYASFVTGDHETAVAACRRAIAIRNNEPGVYVTLGSALLGLGKVDEAASAYRRSLRILPGYPDAAFHLAMVNLMRGRFRDGWAGFDYRFKGPRATKRTCEPRWNGTSLKGRTLHVMREQGLGDDIMYASCYPQLIADASRCVIECEPRLEKLFQRSFPEATFFPIVDNASKTEVLDIDGIDVRIFSASVPAYLRNSLRDFPEHQGYLKVDPVRSEYWRSRLACLGSGLKIGLSWRGGTVWTHSRRRTLDLKMLLPLLKLRNVQWVNLQYGERAVDLETLRSEDGIEIADWTEAIDGDFDETAALVDGLDLVISVCTSVIHLTGALGRKAWVMVPFAPEWRYGSDGDRMPWYPAVRLYRQVEPGNWVGVINEIKNDLIALVQDGDAVRIADGKRGPV